MSKPLMKNWKEPDGREFEICDDAARNGYYSTERRSFDNATKLTIKDIYDLYDNLTDTRNEFTDNNGEPIKDSGGNPIYEYVFSTGEYNLKGKRGVRDTNITKPVILVQSGIHGTERAAVLSTYKFFEDLAYRRNIPAYIPEGAIFKVVPLVVPVSFDSGAKSKTNAAGVNINRNFDYDFAVADEGTNDYSGKDPCDQPETQAITKWLNDNKDAVIHIDMHNSGNTGLNGTTPPNEVAMAVGLTNEAATKAKKIAAKGIERVIPFWSDVMGYDRSKNLFFYSSYVDAGGGCVYYAAGKLNIPSIAVEVSAIQNYGTQLSAETIAAGAEALGNILIEAFEQMRW